MANQIVKKISLHYEMELLTGLRVGDSKENIDIGGIDLPVIRRKIKSLKDGKLVANNEPYIPGSSIKGKLRSLLELATGTGIEVNIENKKINPFDFYSYGDDSKFIPILFGSSGDNGTQSRLIVRDAYLTEESAQLLADSDFTEMPYTEVKFENTIDRISGKASNPRKIERIPAGAKFDVYFVINVFEAEGNGHHEKLKTALTFLEMDYLGGMGSRGYGQVKFKPMKEETIEISSQLANKS